MQAIVDIKWHNDPDYEGEDERFIVTVNEMTEIPDHMTLSEAVDVAYRELTENQGITKRKAKFMVSAIKVDLINNYLQDSIYL